MTREEERELVENIGTLQNDIDRLKHDYETRTCENCTHYDGKTCTHIEYTGCGEDKDFGCNRFERVKDAI